MNKSDVIIAIDTSEFSECIRRIDMMAPYTNIFKLGHLAYSGQYFWQLVDYIKEIHEKDIFLDLKLWDIPSTVENTIGSLLHKGPNFQYITIQYDCLPKETIEKISQHITPIAVMSLSSSSDTNKGQTQWSKQSFRNFGYNHAICPPMYLQKREDIIQFTPGIRLDGQFEGNHYVTFTPQQAMAMGANKIILGSALFNEIDPIATISKILKE
jgi:orotidine-5'-phosphate decarboxylase